MAHAASKSCPICQRALPSGKPTPPYPFCSPRCRLIDLGNWLGDGYVIASPSLGDMLDGENAPLDEESLLALLREPS